MIEVEVSRHRTGRLAIAPGSPCYHLSGIGDHKLYLMRTRSGKWVERWERPERLISTRLKIISPAHALYDRIHAYMELAPHRETTERRVTRR